MEHSKKTNLSEQVDLKHAHRVKIALRWSKRLSQWAINIVFIVSALLVFTPLGNRLNRAIAHVDPLEKAEYLVILGGERERAAEGARLYREKWADTVIVTSSATGADDLAHLTQAYGVPEDSIIIDRNSRCTADHPDNVAALEGVNPATDRFIIVTSVQHTRRARACFVGKGYRHVIMRGPGWREQGGILPDRPNWVSRARDLGFMARESLAWAWYTLTGKFTR